MPCLPLRAALLCARLSIVPLATLLAAPAFVRAQVVTADEGTFTITREGARVGREEFRIVRQPVAGGQEYVARGLAAYGDRRLTAALQTDVTGVPLRYQVDVREGGETESRLTGTVTHGRFSAQVRTARGEAASEFVTGDGSVLIDDELFHQYFFVALGTRVASGAATMSVLVPRRNAQTVLRVSRSAADAVTINGQAVPATRLVISGAGQPERQLWVDAAGRVLKVAVPSQGVVAVRDDPPAI